MVLGLWTEIPYKNKGFVGVGFVCASRRLL